MTLAHWSKAFDEIIDYFNAEGFEVILMGVRASHYLGLPTYRSTEDLDLSVSASLLSLRETVSADLRKRGFDVQWRPWGIAATKNGGRIYTTTYPITYDTEFAKRSKKHGSFIVPCLEDQVILKLISTGKKDKKDAAKYLASYARELDLKYLTKRATESGTVEQVERLLKASRRGKSDENLLNHEYPRC